MRKIDLYLFGLGNVGSTLIQQILDSHHFFKATYGIDLRIVGLSNSSKVLTIDQGIDKDWKSTFYKHSVIREKDSFYRFAWGREQVRIAIDATASKDLSFYYPELANNGFHIVTANKVANSLSQGFYDDLRTLFYEKNLSFQYETNVGAGLPIIETVKNLYESGEQIFAINGVFSGSLSYIFNRFSNESEPFSRIVLDALKDGYTEPDPREDLSGNDVARKLLVLAREIGLKLEFADIDVDSLVTPALRTASLNQFLTDIDRLDEVFYTYKSQLNDDEVLRHLGKLDAINKTLTVTVEAVKKDSAAGQLKGSDAFFEIYSESYALQPLVIKGAGAGKKVTSRGLLSDIIKIASTVKQPVLV